MRLLAPVRSWVLLLALVATGDAVALSRAMWAEFNAIYLVNLKPTADCSPYRARSLDLTMRQVGSRGAALDRGGSAARRQPDRPAASPSFS